MNNNEPSPADGGEERVEVGKEVRDIMTNVVHKLKSR
jgi:hypothetical protein